MHGSFMVLPSPDCWFLYTLYMWLLGCACLERRWSNGLAEHQESDNTCLHSMYFSTSIMDSRKMMLLPTVCTPHCPDDSVEQIPEFTTHCPSLGRGWWSRRRSPHLAGDPRTAKPTTHKPHARARPLAPLSWLTPRVLCGAPPVELVSGGFTVVSE